MMGYRDVGLRLRGLSVWKLFWGEGFRVEGWGLGVERNVGLGAVGRQVAGEAKH